MSHTPMKRMDTLGSFLAISLAKEMASAAPRLKPMMSTVVSPASMLFSSRSMAWRMRRCPPNPMADRYRVADARARPLADALEIQAAALLAGVIILQRVFVRGEEVAHVAVARGVFLVFVAGSIECVERHGKPPSCRVMGQ